MSSHENWGLTEKGFRRPSYTEILDAYEFQARERLTRDGKTPNLTVRSPLGILFRIWAWITSNLFQLLEDVYNSQFIDTAVGHSLYQIGRHIGLRLLPAQRASGYLLVTGREGVSVPAGFLVGTASGIRFAVQLSGVIGEDGAASVPIQCVEMGTIGNVDKNTVTHIVTVIEGITDVTNQAATEGGRGRETDEQFRDRYYRSVDFAGGVNADAIQAEIRQKVEGILAARVYENDTDFEDSRGLPPHSVEAVVFGGLAFEIAKAIYRRKAAGIQTFGSSMVEVVSPQSGQVYEMRFTRPVGVPIWIRLDNIQTDSGKFPINGAELIREAFINYIGSDIAGGLNIGMTVFFNRLPCQINGISGLIDYNMAISADGINYSTDNIPIGEREKAITYSSHITVEL
jgi:uncharacterized phage protein gp47/JayE